MLEAIKQLTEIVKAILDKMGSSSESSTAGGGHAGQTVMNNVPGYGSRGDGTEISEGLQRVVNQTIVNHQTR